MTDKTVSTLRYATEDYDLLSAALGFADPNRDGALTQRELRAAYNDSFRDFYVNNLNSREKAMFENSVAVPLTAEYFAAHPVWSDIAIDRIRHRENQAIIAAHGLPASPDEAKLGSEFAGKIPAVFHQVVLDIPEWKKNLSVSDWQKLTRDDLSGQATPTLAILRNLIASNGTSTGIHLTFENWQKHFSAHGNPGRSTAESTWQEILLSWQRSDPDCHPVYGTADWIYNLTSGGLIRPGRPDMTINAAGLKKLIRGTAETSPPISRPPDTHTSSPLKEGRLLARSQWADRRGARVELARAQGVSINLDIDPGATISVYQGIQNSELPFHAGEPLLRLDGFHLNIDAASTFLKNADAVADSWLKLIGKTFDVETLSGVAVTVFRNRLCLVVRGEANNADIVKPLGNEYLIFDISPFIRSALQKQTGSNDINNELFDTAGNLHSSVSIADLQDAVFKALKSSTPGSGTSAARGIPLSPWTHEFDADNILASYSRMTLIGSAAESVNSINIDNINLTAGRFHGEGRLPNDFTLQGKFNLDLAVNAGSKQTLPLSASAQCYFDTAKNAGYLRLTFPGFDVANKGSALDGHYNGEILIGLDFDIAAFIKDGEFSLEKFLKSVSARTLLDLQKNRRDFLAAAIRLNTLTLHPDHATIAKIILDYDLALTDKGSSLRAVLHDGKLTWIQPETGNPYLTGMFDVLAKEAIAGIGPAAIWGRNVTLGVWRDDKGAWHLRPATSSASIKGPKGATRLANLAGELEIHPPGTPGNPDSKNFVIHAHDISVQCEDALIETADTIVRGKLRGTLNGDWTVAATDFSALLKFNKNWVGRGTIKINGNDSELKVTAKNGTTGVQSSSNELEIEFEVGNLRFAPVQLSASAVTRVRGADLKLDTSLFSASSDMNGQIKATGDFPELWFESRNRSDTEPLETPLPPTRLPEALTIAPGFNENVYLNDLLNPVIQTMLNEAPTDFDFSNFLESDFPLESFAASIEDAEFSIGSLPVSPPRESKKARDGKSLRYPLFDGIFKFLNPRFNPDTVIHTENRQQLAVDGNLNEFRIDLSAPVIFAGAKIQAFGVAERKKGLGLFLFTPKGRINILSLMTIFKPCKMSRVYREAKRAGLDVKPCGVPRNVTEFAAFLEIFLDVFKLRAPLTADTSSKDAPFTEIDFRDASRRKLDQARISLDSLAVLAEKASRRPATFAEQLNTAAQNPDLAQIFLSNLGVFPPENASWATDIIDGILLLKYMSDENGMTETVHQRIVQDNYRLLRLFLAPYLSGPDIIDLNRSRDLDLDLNLKPVKADYGIISINADANTEVGARVRYNPTQTETERSHPGLYLSGAPREDDAFENVSFHYKTPSVFIDSDFDRVEGVEYYLGPATSSHSSDFSVQVENYQAKNVQYVYMPPSPFNRPAFAAFYEDRGLDENNRLEGSLFAIDQVSDDVNAKFSIDRGGAENSLIYFYLGESGEERDILIDAASASFRDIAGDLEFDYDAITKTTTATANRISGYTSIENLPHDKPRALLYLGMTSDGTRRYLVINKFELRGKFDVENDSLVALAHLGFLATLPETINDTPFSRELSAKGVDFKIDAVELHGTMKFFLDADRGGIEKSEFPLHQVVSPEDFARINQRLPLATTKKPEFVHGGDGIRLKLYGTFRFKSQETEITLTELSIPLDAFMMKLVTENNELGATLTKSLLDSFIIPAQEPLTGEMDMTVHTGGSYGMGDISLQDADFSVTSASPFQFSLDGNQSPAFSTSGITSTINNSENSLDITTGQIRYLDGKGQVQNWRLDTHTKDQLYKLIVDAVLSGSLLNFETK